MMDAVIGISQGATLMAILMYRGKVRIDKAVLDGVYVAHQGKLCARVIYICMRKWVITGQIRSNTLMTGWILCFLKGAEEDGIS